MPPAGICELSPSRRGAICILHSLGYSCREIAKQCNCAPSTVTYTVQRDRNYHTRNSLPRSGRPSTLTDRKIRLILHEVKKNRTTPYTGIA
ncbi:hypothetical protein BD311DRAFT_661385, partial [Dichomitus squalens]